MSILNPYVLLGLVLGFLGTFWVGYTQGVDSEADRQKIEVARLNEEARQKESALVAAVNQQAKQLVKANQNAKLVSQKRDAAIDAGSLQLRVPVKTTCPIPVPQNATATSGDNGGTAELQPETAKAILAIGDDADNTARKLNACIQAYNTAIETLKGKP